MYRLYTTTGIPTRDKTNKIFEIRMKSEKARSILLRAFSSDIREAQTRLMLMLLVN